jgi:hypothetical protein
MLFDLIMISKIIIMKYIIVLAFVILFIGCNTTREIPDDRYQQPYDTYGYNYSDPYYTPGYDYNYRERVYYDNNYYGSRNRHRQYRYDTRQPQYRYQQQQPQYKAVPPRIQPRNRVLPRIIEPRVVQPRDKRYPDGTIRKADGEIIHPGQRDRN